MRHRFLIIGVGLLVLMSNLVTQGTSQLLAQLSGQVNTAQNPRPKLIVTTLGRVVEGNISYTASGYMVDVDGGSFLVPFSLVKFTADSRHDAYLKYRKIMPEPTANHHIQLAKWCLNYKLLKDASHELKQALFLDETRRDAAKLLAYVEQMRNGEVSETTSNAKVITKPSVKPAISLQGLSPDLVKEYHTAIQPVLMNNCAKAGCHHSRADNGFKLNYVRLTGYGNRISSSENLAQVLNQINPSEPQQSPFLVRSRENHGSIRDSLALAPQGQQILARMEKWVLDVSEELEETESFPASSSSMRTDSEPAPQNSSSGPGTLDRNQLPKNREKFVQEILQKQYDPFSPDRFNDSLRPSGN